MPDEPSQPAPATAPATSSGARITAQEVRHVAKLARLAVPEDQMPRFTSQLEGILAYVAKLGEVDVAGVEMTAHSLPLKNVLREDVAKPGLSLEDVLRNAPDTDPPFFKVPKILGGDEDSAG
ncbi:MAG: Asp-tRNA(Asn)/Glu-tRNA(Gln) amidotransferase subunit GatC [Phycisphaerae bacterium]